VDMAPTPATQGGPVPGVPVLDGALNSDNNNSFISSLMQNQREILN